MLEDLNTKIDQFISKNLSKSPHCIIDYKIKIFYVHKIYSFDIIQFKPNSQNFDEFEKFITKVY